MQVYPEIALQVEKIESNEIGLINFTVNTVGLIHLIIIPKNRKELNIDMIK